MLHGNKAYALAGDEHHAESVKEWARVIDSSDQPVPLEPRVQIAIELAHIRKRAQALSHVQDVESSEGVSGDDCKNLAHLYTLCVAAARDDGTIPPEQRKDLRRSDIAAAIRWLKSAADAGFFRDAKNIAQAREDPDLEVLRGNCEFRRIIGHSQAELGIRDLPADVFAPATN
jgi:hypothetical protein